MVVHSTTEGQAIEVSETRLFLVVLMVFRLMVAGNLWEAGVLVVMDEASYMLFLPMTW